MIIDKDKSVVDRVGVATENKFTIKNSAKAFQILSSNLYSDKLSAIIREISCNAYDAHVAAGKADTPFDIHLPTYLEPWFSVIDYGTGMSDEDIQGKLERKIDAEDGIEYEFWVGGLYRTYFDSTKTDSNEFVGALGLGSKSPLSYVDSFMVTSNYNGVKNIYTIFKNEDNIPSITLMHSSQTDAINGIEIQISINPNDISEFNYKADLIYGFFKVYPNIINKVSNYHRSEFVCSINEPGWRAGKLNYGNSYNRLMTANQGFYAIQGNVHYPVSFAELKLSDSEISIFSSFSRHGTILIDFEIGELEVSASRESLHYSSATVANIKAKIALVFNTYIGAFVDRLNSYNELPLYDQITASYKEIGLIFDHVDRISKIYDILNNYGFEIPYIIDWLKNSNNCSFIYAVSLPENFELREYQNRGNKVTILRESNRKIITYEDRKKNEYSVSIPNTNIYLNDCREHAKRLASVNRNNIVLLIKHDKDGKVVFPTPEEIDELSKLFLGCVFKRTSELTPINPRPKRDKVKKGVIPLYNILSFSDKYDYCAVKLKPVNQLVDYSDKPIWYVPVKGRELRLGDMHYDVDLIHKLGFYSSHFDILENLSKIIKKRKIPYYRTTYSSNIYAVMEEDIPKIKRMGYKWYNINRFGLKLVKEFQKEIEIEYACRITSDNFKILSSYRSSYASNRDAVVDFIKFVNELEDGSSFKKSMKFVNDLILDQTNRVVYDLLLGMYLRWSGKSDNIEILYNYNKVCEQYPMLSFTDISDFSSKTKSHLLMDYIKMIDERG